MPPFFQLLEANGSGGITSLAVVDQDVDSAACNTLDGILDALSLDGIAEALDRFALAQEVGTNAGNMGRSHGRTGDGLDPALNPGRRDVGARGKDVNSGAGVRVRGETISLGSGTNSAGRRLRGRRVATCVLSVVTGSDSKEEAGAGDFSSGVVDGFRLLAAERHVDNDTLGTRLAVGIFGDVFHTSNDSGAMVC